MYTVYKLKTCLATVISQRTFCLSLLAHPFGQGEIEQHCIMYIFHLNGSHMRLYTSTRINKDFAQVLFFRKRGLRLHIRPAQFFLRYGTNSTVEFWPKCEWTPNFIANRQCLTTPLKLQMYQYRANSNCLGDLQNFRGVVKHCRNVIKFSVHSHFGQNFTVEFVPVLQKNLGWPTVRMCQDEDENETG